jgi:nicotinamide-nucleotide amidase
VSKPAKKTAPGPAQLAEKVREVLELAHRTGSRIVTAESCTGGSIAALLTDVRGLGHCFDRGFVVYDTLAKSEMLGLDPEMIERCGVVSAEVSRQLALAALDRSNADIAIAITGFAGPGAPDDESGLVHIAVSRKKGPLAHRECHFRRDDRDQIRALSTAVAMEMCIDLLTDR